MHKAHYVLMNIECDQETLNELEHAFRFNDAVLRHLIVHRTEPVTEPSPMMRAEKARPPSGERERRRPRRAAGRERSLTGRWPIGPHGREQRSPAERYGGGPGGAALHPGRRPDAEPDARAQVQPDGGERAAAGGVGDRRASPSASWRNGWTGSSPGTPSR